MATDYNWPRPYMLDLYQRVIEEGCLRIVLRGKTKADRDAEFKSFKASFYRMRRRKDGDFIAQMRPEFSMVQVKYEPELGKVLLIFNALPDGELLPSVESVDDKHVISQPLGAQPHITPETDPEEDFDATEHVAGLINNLTLDDDEEPSSEL